MIYKIAIVILSIFLILFGVVSITNLHLDNQGFIIGLSAALAGVLFLIALITRGAPSP